VKDAVGKMKQFASHFSHGIPNGSVLRTQIFQAKEPLHIREIVDHFFESAHV
jgi:tRNA-dihydrouridine synthase B